ncbi:hypothetical protein [Priestia aryabhattai]|jgi:hypothetical protein|uniref:hypothetical protein n=1 Tax=Priestia aryabhattai TaxID=412384 RepID=UPI00040AC91D
MEKYKINQIIQNHTLTNTEIPYMSDLGLRFVKVDALVNAMLQMKGKAFKEIYRMFLRNKNDKEALLQALSSFATSVAKEGYIFGNENDLKN